ncbi:uncharacterized protein LOC129754438 [Uranotaenia lowii]|uniref:uncharacterized protein LOC129754438 n=1 Tax=Uranotaenia lowii TaxID=190385 RepID=UPI002478BE53|nr:uncharacterized protein LOC129754438 [Uranotaenia lowii]
MYADKRRKRTARSVPGSTSTKSESQEDDANSGSSSDELVIDIPNELQQAKSSSNPEPFQPKQTRSMTGSSAITPTKTTPPAKQTSRSVPVSRRKRKRSPSCSSTEEIEDPTLEETIERCAVKNNLTTECVQKLLKKLVMNEHVLAIVKLKEEEEERNEKLRKDSLEHGGADSDDEGDELQSVLPKLTRLKAKQLNKKPLPIVPLKVPIADEEVAALIREELGSDEDDDEEYKPTEEDLPSDEDLNTTISDLDSQPRTPVTPATPGRSEDIESEATALYSKDGVFKIPRFRNDSHCSQQSEQEQENIARRTRSKLCLQTTAIETIESTFIPPDITTDMYDFDCDMDHVWKEFLTDFVKPLSNHNDDDDDADPEYVAADTIPVDPEELRQVNVSKKELNELVSELLEMSGIIDESFLDNSVFNSAISPDLIRSDTNENADSVDKRTSKPLELNTDKPRELTTPEQQNHELALDQSRKLPQPLSSATLCPVPSRQSEVFNPSNVSTPIASQSKNKVGNNTALSIAPPVYSTIDPCPTVPAVPVVVNVETSAFHSQVPVSQFHTFSQPQYTNYNRLPNKAPYPSTSYQQHPQHDPRLYALNATPKQYSFQGYYPSPSRIPNEPVSQSEPRKASERRYKYLEKLTPVRFNFPKDQKGFTDLQMQIYQQQLRMHVQFAAQNFLQTYAHPKFWELAETFKKILLELQEMAKTIEAARACNLEPAIKCCLSWEKDLQDINDENNEMMQFLLKQEQKAEKAKKEHKYYVGYFPYKMMKQVLNCKAFMYPKLLPYLPFRMDYRATKKAISLGEERLIAFGLELFHDIMTKENSKNNLSKNKKPSTFIKCRYISRFLLHGHPAEQIYNYVIGRKAKPNELNPITYYFKYLKAPPYTHELEDIDLRNILSPCSYRKGVLPQPWDNYLNSKKELVKYRGPPQRRNSSIQTSSKSSKQTEPVQVATITEESSTNLNITISLSLDPAPSASTSSVTELRDPNPQISDPVEKISEQLEEVQSLASFVTKFKPENSPIRDNSFSGRFLLEVNKEEIREPEAEEGQNIAVHKHQFRVDGCCHCNCHSDDSLIPNCLDKGQKKLTDYFRPVPKNPVTCQPREAKLKDKLSQICLRFRKVLEVRKRWSNTHLGITFEHFKLIEIFTYFLDDLKKMSCGQQSRNDCPLTNGSGRKPTKVEATDDKDCNYAYNFFEKVEETLLAENKRSEYEQFLDILQNFDDKEDHVPDLYRKIENLLVADHPELVDLFLTFLLPGQAAEVGKFFEHFILTSANDFLTKLNIYFAKQPSQIKKIYTSLNELSNEPDVTMEQIKSKIVPLLKGNQLLIDWFLQLFPPEKPPDSTVSDLSDYEVISAKRFIVPEGVSSSQTYEDIPFVEPPAETGSENTICGTKYIQGKIMCGTLPARLSFLAHDSQSCQQQFQRAMSPLKGCMHNVDRSAKLGSDGEDGKSEQDFGDCMTASDSMEDSMDRYKLCDEATFKAHAIRLNPLVHGRKGVSYSDVEHLLVPPESDSEESPTIEDEDKFSSPKKQNAQPKAIVKKRINSPVNKKLPAAASTSKVSPTCGGKKTFPSVPVDSKVIAVSKKLKSMVEEVAEEPSTESDDEGFKRKIPMIQSQPVTQEPEANESKPVPKPEELEPPKCSATESQNTQTGLTSVPQNNWTRDEDKIILEEIKKGSNAVEELIERIGAKIVERNASEIRVRYEFLIEVLKKFQKGNK